MFLPHFSKTLAFISHLKSRVTYKDKTWYKDHCWTADKATDALLKEEYPPPVIQKSVGSIKLPGL